jgi:hypothetical protein
VAWGWFKQPVVLPEPPHVRLHVVHQGSASGDMTIEGYLVGGDADWVWVDRAILVEADGRRRFDGGRVEVPRSRILLKEPLFAMSLPELSELVES